MLLSPRRNVWGLLVGVVNNNIYRLDSLNEHFKLNRNQKLE